jgi:xylulokinase
MAVSRDAGPLVIGLDSSTQSTKVLVVDAAGDIVAEGRAPIPFSSPFPGAAEQNPEDWWTAAVDALGQATRQVDVSRVVGLAISNQRETSAFLDADGRALHPALLWLDERGNAEIAGVVAALGAARLHETSGKAPDVTPAIYRLAWMRRHKPEVLERSRYVLDVQGFLLWRLAGAPATSWTSADPWGLFDIARKEWSAPLRDHVGIAREKLAPAHRPATRLGEVSAAAAAATGLARGTPIFAAGGDGQCAGLGVDAVRPGRVYLNLGTAIITGLWTGGLAIGRHWRTMTSPTGDGYFLESCLRAGAFMLNWFAGAMAGGQDAATFARLEEAAARLPIGAEGLLLCPYLSGCMDPHWDPNARAAYVGLSANHGIGHMYRAMLEAITLESARAIAAMVEAGIAAEEIVAIGGGARSALWRQIYADATGLPVLTGRTVDASAVGAAMTAAVGAGLHPGFAAAAQAMSRLEPATQPEPAAGERYAALAELHGEVYRANAALFARLAPWRMGAA